MKKESRNILNQINRLILTNLIYFTIKIAITKNIKSHRVKILTSKHGPWIKLLKAIYMFTALQEKDIT